MEPQKTCRFCNREFDLPTNVSYAWQKDYCCENCWLDSDEYTVGVILLSKLLNLIDKSIEYEFYEIMIQVLSSDNYVALLAGVISELYETKLIQKEL